MKKCSVLSRKRGTSVELKRIHGSCTKSVTVLSTVPAYFLIPIILLLSTKSINAQFQTCSSQLMQADSNTDEILNQEEYATAVSLLSWGTIVDDFETLPLGLQDMYSNQVADGSSGIDIKGVGQNGTASASQQENLGVICSEIITSILDAASLEMTQQECFTAMAIGDTNRDDFLAKTIEFPRFANQISGGKYGYTVTFYALPDPVQQIFGEFVNVDDQINITGSKPGESIDATQEFFLWSLCNQTAVAAIAVRTQTETSSSTMAPTTSNIPAPSPSYVGNTANSSLSYGDCTTAMALSDLDRDDALNQVEYLRFLNRLTDSKYANTTYNTLPQSLQESYDNLKNGDGNIDVAGSKPGQSPDGTQVANLENVCDQTGTALQNAESGEPSPSELPTTPTPAPAMQPTVSSGSGTMIPFTKCKQDMLISDMSRDDMLDQAEYVRFVSRNAENVDATGDFEALPTALKDNYFSLADESGQIPIAGSKPGQTATGEEVANLERICTETAIAIDKSSGALGTPTTSPGAGQASSTLNILNAFVISNMAGLRADSLTNGRNRDALAAGYANFTSLILDEFMMNPTTSRYRRLTVTSLINGTQEVYRIDDSVCPDYVQNKNSFCQVAYAKFQITAEGEQDPTKLETQISKYSQKAIDDGLLQACIEAADPGVSIKVEASTEPIVPPGEQTIPPTDNVGGAEPVGGGGPSAGGVVGILAALSTTIGAGVWYFRRNGGEGMCTIPLFNPPSTSKPVHPSETDEEQLDVMEDIENGGVTAQPQNIFGGRKKFNHEPADARNGLSGIFGPADRGTTRDDDDSGAGFSVQEQSPEQSRRQQSGSNEKSSNTMFGAFGLGKAKRALNSQMNDTPEVFLEDNAASQDGAQDDYDSYAFDDPTVMRQDSMGDVFRNKNDGEWDDDHEEESGNWDEEWQTNQKSGEVSNGPDSVSGSSGSDEESRSYDESSGSESDSYVDDDDFTRDSRGNSSYGESPGTSIAVLPESMRHLDSLVDQGDWDGVMAAAANFEVGRRDDRSAPSEKSGSNDKEDSESSKSSFSGNDSYPEEDTFYPGEPVDFDDDDGLDHNSGTSLTMTSEELRRRDQYRSQVETLVRKCAPEEIDNVGKMLDQFAGREAELISTLQSMYQRAASQRARKAVHKSRALPERDPRTIMSGGTEGSTAIAAASTIGGSQHEAEQVISRNAFMEREQDNMDNDGNYNGHTAGGRYYYDNANEGSYSDHEEESDENDDSNYSAGEESGSYDSGERRQMNDRQGSYDDEDQSTYDDDDDDDQGSYDDDDDQGSYDDDDDQGSYDDDDDDQGSYDDDGGSYRDDDEGRYESGENSDGDDSYDDR